MGGGGVKGEEVGLRCEGNHFRDRERGSMVGETDELVIFIILVVVLSLTSA